jgi:hypothetical protein
VTNFSLYPRTKPKRSVGGPFSFFAMLLIGIVFIGVSVYSFYVTVDLWICYLFMVAGIFMVCLAPVSYLKDKKRSREIQHLLKNGTKLQGHLTYIKFLGSPGREDALYEAKVVARNSAGVEQEYTSDTVGLLAGSHRSLNFSNCLWPVDVYVDDLDPTKYYIDVKALPALYKEDMLDLEKKGVIIELPGYHLGRIGKPSKETKGPFM